MANIKKGARAYYADTDYRRDGTIEAYGKIDDLPAIPTPEDSDVGKVIKVNDSGVYGLSDDLHTPVVANPEGAATAELKTITIGDTIYKVNDARVIKILGLRFTIDNGGTYNAKMPLVSFVNEYGEAAQVPTYKMTCDKPLQYGDPYLNGNAAVQTPNLPAVFTVHFNSEFNIEDFANIKLENSGLFPGDIAKNIKVEYSVNDSDWLEIFDKVSIDWTNTVHIYDMSTGEEITTKSPIPEPTAADAGKVLSVDSNGAWELDNIPSELPTVTSADAGKVLTVDNAGALEFANVPSELPTVTSADVGKVLTVNNQGAWGAENAGSRAHNMLITMSNIVFDSTANTYTGTLTLVVDNDTIRYDLNPVDIDYGALFGIHISTQNLIDLNGVGCNYNLTSTTRACLTRVLQNCAFINNINNKMYKITNITGSKTVFTFELVEISA